VKPVGLLVTEPVERAGTAADHAGWGVFAALGEDEGVGALFQQFNLVDRAETAAMAAGTAAIGA
jgi:hypothetical protein